MFSFFVCFFFFKQKTAYEMRISDWSSDVCSSTRWVIPKRISVRKAAESNLRAASVASPVSGGERQLSQLPQRAGGSSPKWLRRSARRQHAVSTTAESGTEERRVGTECVSTCRSRGPPSQQKKTTHQKTH